MIYLGVCSLGVAAGLLGCFLLFRKRSLLSDTIGHSILPGVALFFIIATQLGWEQKSIIGLLLGGGIFGWLSVQAVQWIVRSTRLGEDVAMAIVLAVFYGFGVVLLSVIQMMGASNASGLEYYLFGMVASMLKSEALILTGGALVTVSVVAVFFKELNLLCFDEEFFRVQGITRSFFDQLLVLMTLLLAIIGVESVGLLMVMALFIIPPATARMWTQSMPLTLILAAGIGGIGGGIGAWISAQVPRLPAGASIILVMALLFSVSLLFGAQRGWVVRLIRYRQLEKNLLQNQFLRAVFDSLEHQQQIRLLCGREFSRRLALVTVSLKETLAARHWNKSQRQRIARRLVKRGLFHLEQEDQGRLSPRGLERAIEVAKTHRLTELYLLEYAELAPQNIHQYVEKIEEITTPDIAQDLRDLFHSRLEREVIPMEPHA